MGEVISEQMRWKDDGREYSKHFDYIAEPLTNYVRHKRFGYERRICQFSNMVRKGEISRKKALYLYSEDRINTLPLGSFSILEYLGINEEQLKTLNKSHKCAFRKKPPVQIKFMESLCA